MTEQGNEDKYINCSRCKMKYHNDDEHIKVDFGLNRLGERFKTCLNCREKKRPYNMEYSKTYYEDNKEAILQKNQEYREQNRETIRERGKEEIECNVCGAMVRKYGLARHQGTSKCMSEDHKPIRIMPTYEKTRCKLCQKVICVKNIDTHQQTQYCKTQAERIKRIESDGQYQYVDGILKRREHTT